MREAFTGPHGGWSWAQAGPLFLFPPRLAMEALDICENEEDHVMSPREVTGQPQQVSAPAPAVHAHTPSPSRTAGPRL